jgi:hypothetical protein
VYGAISDASNDRERACEEVLGDVPHDVPWFQGGSGSRHLEAQVLLEVQAACMCENMQDCGAPSWVLSLCWTVQSEERGEGAPARVGGTPTVKRGRVDAKKVDLRLLLIYGSYGV